ncbi:MAG: hypothetical protein COU81_03100 [Candidatus Portnoybacteria bacterium CG10_big_fil_rev_8_21_14_0_10_36_7]|uniref:Protease PrsW n=1 Tax=Candidatus Portnoybacteria bacterium CG10_big_fil_rev_8_21_14_0_10_36_7 TaxID=1974812 RepID=A0A2M8KDJ4_9BACT|nr:MAG: hypothetical protein COU81_03100 [Candidatus Portnoybacteria bacterium CG10_big_fil_rev_8_21_14_0_10_36_7]
MIYQEYFSYTLIALLGFLPSIVWLLFYLKKDAHPEPNHKIIEIFLWGMASILVAGLLQVIYIWIAEAPSNWNNFLLIINSNIYSQAVFLNLILIAPITEETLKFLIVKFRVLHDEDFDEPLDAMLYMVIVALGFAAGENILILINSDNILPTLIMRFLGATLLHTLAAGTMGYFLATGYFKTHLKYFYITLGFITAFIIHGIYNYLIVALEGFFKNNATLVAPTLLMLVLFLFITSIIVSALFTNLKKYPGDCKL